MRRRYYKNELEITALNLSLYHFVSLFLAHFVSFPPFSLSALEQFRDGHIQIVALYIISQKHRVNKSQSLQAMGTGGTNLMGFLKHVRDETINAKHVE